MSKWYHADDGNAEVLIEADTPREAAQEYVDDGDWGENPNTIWISVLVWEDGETQEDGEWHTIRLDPEEPDCEEVEHDWRSPYSLLGGLRENPGVWAHGGGAIITEVCRHCGVYRTTDTWAQDPNTGRQGLRSVEYSEATEESLAWVERRKADAL